MGLPVWPLMTLLVGSLAVAETLKVALAFAAQATLLATAEAAREKGVRTVGLLARCISWARAVTSVGTTIA